MKLNLKYGFMLALLTAAAVLSVSVRHGRAVPLRRNFSDFPLVIGEWRGASQGKFPEGILQVLQVSDYLNSAYRRGSDQVTLYVGYYRSQRAGESIHSPKNCLPGGGWEVLESRRIVLDIPSVHKTIEANGYVVQKDEERQFILYWYDTHGRVFASEYLGKAILVWEALRTGRTDGAIVRIMTPYPLNSQPEPIVADFARQVYPLLKEYLPE